MFKLMLDPEIKPIYADNTNNFSYSTRLLDELNKELTLLFTGSKSFDNAVADIKSSLKKVYEQETKK